MILTTVNVGGTLTAMTPEQFAAHHGAPVYLFRSYVRIAHGGVSYIFQAGQVYADLVPDLVAALGDNGCDFAMIDPQ